MLILKGNVGKSVVAQNLVDCCTMQNDKCIVISTENVVIGDSIIGIFQSTISSPDTYDIINKIVEEELGSSDEIFKYIIFYTNYPEDCFVYVKEALKHQEELHNCVTAILMCKE